MTIKDNFSWEKIETFLPEYFYQIPSVSLKKMDFFIKKSKIPSVLIFSLKKQFYIFLKIKTEGILLFFNKKIHFF